MGDTYVYLFPQNTGRPPSFKVHSTTFAESPSLTFLARGTDPKAQAFDNPSRTVSMGGNPMHMSENDNDSSGSNRMAFVDDDAADETRNFISTCPSP